MFKVLVAGKGTTSELLEGSIVCVAFYWTPGTKGLIKHSKNHLIRGAFKT